MIGVTLVAALTGRIIIGDWQITDALVPAVMLAVFPFFEWIIHVFILHWRPRHIGALTIDPLLAREHRKHHVNPRSIPLIFIPAKALVWVLPLAVAIALLAFPRLGLGLTYLVFVTVLVLVYEWIHYLIHSDYKPKSSVYKAIWRNHRQHHFKNEHYWYTVTSQVPPIGCWAPIPIRRRPNLSDREKPARQRGLASIPGAEIELRLFAWDGRLSGWEGELEGSVVPPWDWGFEVGVAGVDELGVVAA